MNQLISNSRKFHFTGLLLILSINIGFISSIDNDLIVQKLIEIRQFNIESFFWIISLLIASLVEYYVLKWIIHYIKNIIEYVLNNIKANDHKLTSLRNEKNVLIQKFGETKEIKLLYEINIKYLDLYYDQTIHQNYFSFCICITVAIVSFLFIIISLILMLLDQSKAAYISTSVGILGEFIATYIYSLYNSTTKNMSEYHKKLVLSQNISFAIALVEDEKDLEKRTHMKTIIIDQLIKDINQYIAT